MKSNNKVIIRISIIMILSIILLSASSHDRFGNSWLVSWTGSILFMGIVFTSNYIKSYKNKALYFVNNTIAILAMYFLLSRILLNKESAIFMISMYILSTSKLLNNFFIGRRKKKLNN